MIPWNVARKRLFNHWSKSKIDFDVITNCCCCCYYYLFVLNSTVYYCMLFVIAVDDQWALLSLFYYCCCCCCCWFVVLLLIQWRWVTEIEKVIHISAYSIMIRKDICVCVCVWSYFSTPKCIFECNFFSVCTNSLSVLSDTRIFFNIYLYKYMYDRARNSLYVVVIIVAYDFIFFFFWHEKWWIDLTVWVIPCISHTYTHTYLIIFFTNNFCIFLIRIKSEWNDQHRQLRLDTTHCLYIHWDIHSKPFCYVTVTLSF